MKRKIKNKNLPLHLMLLPAVIILILYAYLPMIGVVMAFQKFNISKGIAAFWTSEWVGLANFRRILFLEGSIEAVKNTLIISGMKITSLFVIPIAFSLLLNEVRNSHYKRSIQTLIYLPYFLSWVILGGVLKTLLSGDGVVNQLLSTYFNMEPIFFLGDANKFRSVVIISNLWKEFGFSTIVYLAAITGIDPELYEAGVIDGANRWKQMWHITLPGMRPIIVLTGVLALGGILNGGFDQIFNLYSVPVYSKGDIIDTFVYRLSFQGGQYSIGTAVGLMKSVVSLIMISTSYYLAKKFANYEIF